jgi:YbbR domain-containing protein
MRRLLAGPLYAVWSVFRYQWAMKLASIAIALTVWVLVFGSQTIEITKEIPFEVVLPDDQILVDPVPEKITFKLSGPKAFLRTIQNRMEEPIRAQLKGAKSGVQTHRIFSDAIKLPLGVKVLSITPNAVQLRFEELKRKSLGIRVSYAGELPDGLKSSRLEVNPPMVKVKGPKSRMGDIELIQTVPVDLSAIHETGIVPLAFDFKTLGVDLDGVLPELYIEIQGRGQAFRVRHVPVKVKPAGKAKVTDEEVTVIVRTDPADNVKVDGDQISALVDVRDVPEGEYLKWIRVQLPEKVHLVRTIPPLTRVVVKKP